MSSSVQTEEETGEEGNARALPSAAKKSKFHAKSFIMSKHNITIVNLLSLYGLDLCI